MPARAKENFPYVQQRQKCNGLDTVPPPTPAQLRAQSSVARVMWELGCRGPPLRDEEGGGGFSIGEQLGALDQEDVIDKALKR